MRIQVAIHIQHFMSMRIRIRIQIQGFDDQKFDKIYSWKKTYIFLIKNCFLIPRPPCKTSKLQKSSFLKKENI